MTRALTFEQERLREFVVSEIGRFLEHYDASAIELKKAQKRLLLHPGGDVDEAQEQAHTSYLDALAASCQASIKNFERHPLEILDEAVQKTIKVEDDEAASRRPIVSKIQKALVAKDLDLAQELSAQWLWVKHGLDLGDTVIVYGWAEPRTIKIERVELTPGPEGAERGGVMTFFGPCVKGSKDGRKATWHMASLQTSVVKA